MDAQFLIQTATTLLVALLSAGGLSVWRDRRKAQAEVERTAEEKKQIAAEAASINQGWQSKEFERLQKLLDEEREMSLIRKRAGKKLYLHQERTENWQKRVMHILEGVPDAGTVPMPPHLELTEEEKEALEI